MSEEDYDRQNPRSEKVWQVYCRCRTADDWRLQTDRQPEGPLRRTAQAPDTSCATTRKRKRWAPLTPIMKQRCSTGPQYGRTAESQCSASSDPSLRLQGVALRDGSTNEKPPTPHAPAANNFKICNDFCRITAADEWECS